MEEYSEAFVAFDVAKKKHAVAIAEGGRGGEVRFVGEVEESCDDRADDQEAGKEV
jgi:transposase